MQKGDDQKKDKSLRQTATSPLSQSSSKDSLNSLGNPNINNNNNNINNNNTQNNYHPEKEVFFLEPEIELDSSKKNLETLSPISKKKHPANSLKKRNSHNSVTPPNYASDDNTPDAKSKKSKKEKTLSANIEEDDNKRGFGKMSINFASKSMNTLKNLGKMPATLLSHPLDTLSGKQRDSQVRDSAGPSSFPDKDEMMQRKGSNPKADSNNDKGKPPVQPTESEKEVQSESDLFLTQDKDIYCGWMKLRNTMKVWNSRWFVLKPGKLIYASHERDIVKKNCLGIIRLADCKVEQYQSKSEGFALKISHRLGYSIYSKYGLRQEKIKMANLPLTWSSCVLRCSSSDERKTWMDNLQVAINMTKLPKFKYDTPDTLNENDFPEEPSAEAKEEMKDIMLNVNREEFVSYFPGALTSVQEQFANEVCSSVEKELDEFKKQMEVRLQVVEENIWKGPEKEKKGVYFFSLIHISFFLLACIFLGKLSTQYS